MTDTVRVPREPLEPVVYGDERDELLALIRKRCPDFTAFPECPPEDMVKGGDTERKNDEAIERAFQDFRLAASPQGEGSSADAPMEVVAWRVKDYADGWILFHHEAPARKSGEARNGALVQPLYTHPPQPDALPGDLREKIEIVEEWLSLVDTFTASHFSRVRHVPICQGEIDALAAILSLIQSERGGA